MSEPALDRDRALMMAALDGECTEAERRELDARLAADAALAAEWTRLRRVKEVTMTMGLRQPPEEVWDRYRVSTLHRLERGVAWTLLVLGGSVLAGYALWHWAQAWLALDAPWPIRAAIAAVVIGGVVLLISVARERWRMHRRDPYSREVER